eukprot:scaffold25835_cov129-Isochrysis_galbana.AAC.2
MYWRRAHHRPITSGEVSPDTTTHWWPAGARGSYTHAPRPAGRGSSGTKAASVYTAMGGTGERRI